MVASISQWNQQLKETAYAAAKEIYNLQEAKTENFIGTSAERHAVLGEDFPSAPEIARVIFKEIQSDSLSEAQKSAAVEAAINRLEELNESIAAAERSHASGPSHVDDSVYRSSVIQDARTELMQRIQTNASASEVLRLGEPDSGVQSQEALAARITAANPPSAQFVKDVPVVMYRITADNYDKIPSAIKDSLGSMDKATYEKDGSIEKFMQSRIGGAIALQLNGETPDFYVVPQEFFAAKYAVVEMSEVQAKNGKLHAGLAGMDDVSEVLGSDPNIIGALKTVPVDMFKVSDVGFPKDKALEIAAPWGGTQTKPAGQDAFLVPDGDQFYMINTNDDGVPGGYRSVEA